MVQDLDLTSWSLMAFSCSSFLAQYLASSSGMSAAHNTSTSTFLDIKRRVLSSFYQLQRQDWLLTSSYSISDSSIRTECMQYPQIVTPEQSTLQNEYDRAEPDLAAVQSGCRAAAGERLDLWFHRSHSQPWLHWSPGSATGLDPPGEKNILLSTFLLFNNMSVQKPHPVWWSAHSNDHH